jgi:hypothetical protein
MHVDKFVPLHETNGTLNASRLIHMCIEFARGLMYTNKLTDIPVKLPEVECVHGGLIFFSCLDK